MVLSCLLLLLPTVIHANRQSKQRLEQRKLFAELYQAAQQGQRTKVKNNRHRLANYPLQHYLDYALISAEMSNLPEQEIAEFAKKHPHSPLNKRLKTQLLAQLGKQQKWQQYLKYHNGIDSGKRQCQYLQARIATAQTQKLSPLIKAMWLNGSSVHEACDSVFKWWQKQGQLSEQLILERIDLAYKKNNFSLIEHLRKQLKTEPTWIKQAVALAKKPEQALRQANTWHSNKKVRQLLYHAAMRLAKKQPLTTLEIWQKLKQQHAFSNHQKLTIEREIALFAATDYEPYAISAMQKLPPKQQDDQIKAWIVRYYLYHQNWKKVLTAITKMSPQQQQKDNWQYWLARAYAKNHQPQKAKQIFSKLAQKSNYYGFLAADHLRIGYSLCANNQITAYKQHKFPAAIGRAIELYHLGFLTMARQEWNTTYRSLSHDDKLALAEKVMDEGWYAKAISIMADTGQWQNYRLRYPVAEVKTIKKQSKNSKVAPAWVMAVIKQESAWSKDAVSRANAHGLMQIIPPTAKRLSQQLGVKYHNSQQLHQADFNLKLGIHYQKNLFDRFNHPLLAAAAYNAGERKSEHWSQDFPTAPDIWLETIPYRETRGYITKILFNATIYDWRLNGTPRRISAWMPTMPINNAQPKAWPNPKTAQQHAPINNCQP